MADDGTTSVNPPKRQKREDTKPISLGTTDQTIVTIRVGPEAKDFLLHRELLCHYSKYFHATFKGQFSEGETRQSSRPDTSVRTFGIFVDWLYTQQLCLPYESFTEYAKRTNTEPTVETLNQEVQSRPSGGTQNNPSKDKYPEQVYLTKIFSNEENTKDCTGEFANLINCMHKWAYFDLLNLYVFADEHEVSSLRDSVIILWQLMDEATSGMASIRVISRAFHSLPPESKLCKYLVKSFTALVRAEFLELTKEQQKSLPSEFLWEVCQGYSEASYDPSRICTCGCWTPAEDDFKFPFDWCSFHEHENGNEKECASRCERLRDELEKWGIVCCLKSSHEWECDRAILEGTGSGQAPGNTQCSKLEM